MIDDAGRFFWGGIAEELDADRLLAAPSTEPNGPREDARRLIVDTLRPEPMAATKLSEHRPENISARSWERARADLARERVIISGRTGFQGAVQWALASDTRPHSRVDVRAANDDDSGEVCGPTDDLLPINQLGEQCHTSPMNTYITNPTYTREGDQGSDSPPRTRLTLDHHSTSEMSESGNRCVVAREVVDLLVYARKKIGIRKPLLPCGHDSRWHDPEGNEVKFFICHPPGFLSNIVPHTREAICKFIDGCKGELD